MYLNREWDRERRLSGRHPQSGIPIEIRFKNSVRFSHNDPQAINVYNVILRRCFDQIGLKQMGRNYFDPTRSVTIPNYNMEVWPGYETAIRLYEDKLMLCIENRFKMLRLDNINMIVSFADERRRNERIQFFSWRRSSSARAGITTDSRR